MMSASLACLIQGFQRNMFASVLQWSIQAHRRWNQCEHLSVTGGERLLAPGASTDIDIAFTPREARAYAETLQVSVLGLSTVRLRLQRKFA